MSDFCIVSDVTLDLTPDVIEELDIRVIPMDFHLADTTYTHYPDERELSTEEFYSRLKAGATSITSQINPVIYENFFTRILESGKDILYISLSSGLSGTYNTARMMAMELEEKYPDRKIYCVDSLCASIGEGLLVYLAAKERQKGKSLDEVRDFTEEYKTKCCHWFTVEDLHHLKRGGRLTSLEAVVGTALRICPVLSVDREGKLVVASKVRGTKKALEYLVKRLEEDGIDTKDQTVIVGHAACREYADALAGMLKERNLVKDVIITKIGPVIGTHTGSGMCALTFVGENYKF
ncbi:MAG: DegV family protein [Lachnospiraceae bacterium]|nr:DegV family protein [Lachnospiraceae bacterium]